MSKHVIAVVEQQGISTPCTLANTPESVKDYGRILEDRMLMPMSEATRNLSDLAELFKVIRDMAKASTTYPQDAQRSANTLTQIISLANIGACRADDIGNFIDCEHEVARDDCVPALLKALGGEA